MTAKIVLATLGSHGDIHPFIALGKALQNRGFEVVAATSGHYRPLFEREGLRFSAIGPDEGDALRVMGVSADAFVKELLTDDLAVVRFSQDFLAESVRDLMPVVAGADLVVCHHIAYAAQLAAESFGIPYVHVLLSPTLLLQPEDPPVLGTAPFVRAPGKLGQMWNRSLASSLRLAFRPFTRRARRLRAAMGLPPARDLPFLDPGDALDVLGLFSPLLMTAPKNSLGLGATFHDGGAAQKLAPEVEAFLDGGSPPVVLTLGSFAALGGADILRDGVAAARALGRRALVIAGRDDARAIGAPEGDDLLIWGYAPHSQVFARAAAILHHGGAGTSVQALRAGKPQLIAPFFADQPDNAARVARLGVARVLPRAKFSTQRAVAALRHLLEKPDYALRAGEMAARIGAEDGAGAAAEVIARLVRQKKTPPEAAAPSSRN
ncbi:UDP:flavonoid glycosyltransferase YjiC (YdhE family) [Rhodoblastus acidophilus]|uniref:glycosyltransferase n=1 Tax=Rhodoblastus acidophilus TaxID=1074 RepID=UPI0022245B0A|nr:glycosyltransferase [Rhodoblastus acidophilus]MCW2286117.1 UDP:flavonoid glycosyltransferase YjiC (YdhE family) [Rhodoblastus acidophilus]MCW2335011.1 UDP:flavonoid glycosyltransferase YjiC (YdhE family) [Rhodoblastus acidophilus]